MIDPDDIDPKEFAFTTPDYEIVRICERPAHDGGWCGFVLWTAVPEARVPHAVHKFSIFEAIEKALSFCRTDYENEWLCGSRDVLEIIRSFPQFRDLPPRRLSEHIVLIGQFRRKQIFANLNTNREPLSIVGCGNRACLLKIQEQ